MDRKDLLYFIIISTIIIFSYAIYLEISGKSYDGRIYFVNRSGTEIKEINIRYKYKEKHPYGPTQFRSGKSVLNDNHGIKIMVRHNLMDIKMLKVKVDNKTYIKKFNEGVFEDSLLIYYNGDKIKDKAYDEEQFIIDWIIEERSSYSSLP